MTLLPALPFEALIQLREHCGMRSYAIYGRPNHLCGVYGVQVDDSGNPWEIFSPDVTPKREAEPT